MKALGLASLAAFAAACFLAPSTASAYCIARGCDENSDDQCVRDGYCLISGGVELHWPSNCISYAVQRDGSESDGIDFDTAHALVNVAFDTWLNADCGGMGPHLMVEDRGAVNCHKAEYNQDQGNANIILFRDDDWPYLNSVDALALTTLTYNVKNGQIYDADIEVNSFEATLTVTDSGVRDDFQSIITHEVGHFLGLSHSNIPAATMRPGYVTTNTDLRDLDDDDAEGICALYPYPNVLIVPDFGSCVPRHGFESDCAQPLEESCAMGGPGGSTTAGWALLALVSAGVIRRGRKRRAA